MKKYWKFTAIIAIVLLSIGTFYVNSALSAEEYPEFIIEPKQGDAEQINELVLKGYYEEPLARNYISTKIKITEDGSIYGNNSILNQLIGEPSTVIKKLQDEYHNFMRGKVLLEDSYVENEKLLAYAEVKYNLDSYGASDLRFSISTLDKNEGDTTSFTLNVPDQSEIDYLAINDVQIIDDELYVITRNMKGTGGEVHAYTINISDQKLSSHETIIETTEGQSGSYIDASMIATNPIQANKNLVFLKTEGNIVQETESAMEEGLNQELFTYSLETKEKEEVMLPDSLNLSDHDIGYFDGSTIYFEKFDEDNLVITPFHVENNKKEDAITIQWTNGTRQTPAPVMMVKDGKLYVASVQVNAEIKGNIAVADVKTGEVIFLGEIVRKETSEDRVKFDLYFHDIFLN